MSVPPIAQLQAPASWAAVDVLSDLHLHASEPDTFDAWRRYLHASPADAVIILGDLFEVWVGDDAAAQPGFAADCATVIKEAGHRRAIFFMHGNRDFLVGRDFLRSCGGELLSDPTLLVFAGRRWLLTHGDALCLADTEYMRFRAEVRAPEWQQDFLAKPLPQREQIARKLREQSEARKRSGVAYPDVDSAAALAWLEAADAQVMIHGHTHRPADHALGSRQRIVLSDWDAASTPPRLEVLRLTAGGAQRVALS